MTMRRPLRAAPTLNSAADQPASETPPPATLDEKRATREMVGQIREALIEARLFGPITPAFGQTFSKLICPQKNDGSTPRTLIVVNTDMSLYVRHPIDGADNIRPPLIFKPKEYEGKDLGEFVIAAIEKLHNPAPKQEPNHERVLKL